MQAATCCAICDAMRWGLACTGAAAAEAEAEAEAEAGDARGSPCHETWRMSWPLLDRGTRQCSSLEAASAARSAVPLPRSSRSMPPMSESQQCSCRRGEGGWRLEGREGGWRQG